ncbi:Npt1/Npt2 family nucleotide transporter [Criblamydia sequanensis]|uniref:ADP,ATP carrier protein n=1 Tax=Candidatus Criblamydia sequanensis CRIB-18 TaxID=1437425 RepID=A0A090CYR0_9BACT|nr:Npt1/Npt2 family nucleotide transporter [Criblamydia sequanensis]CDR33792.1 ADP/ATP translocase [Criblamydia sequanensis CRIB-18]
MSSDTKQGEFSTLRAIFFPIYRHEIKKFLPMALMMLFILFNYTILRNVKDSLVVNAKGSDEGIISFLKLYGTTPSAIIFMLIYSKMANIFSREKIFYLCITPFLVFFGLFAFVIYPNIESLHPYPETVFNLQSNFPYLKWFISMWGNWSYCLFYILSELWGSVMVSLLFWQFANEIIRSEEAKRFYPLFGFIGNIGLVMAGFTVSYFCNTSILNTTDGTDPWQTSLYALMSMIILSGAAIMGLYLYTSRKIVPTLEPKEAKVKKSKPKLSMLESFKYIFTSPHLLCIAVLVLCYGVTINFIDVLWKGQVKIYAQGDNNLFAAYMGEFSTTTGIISLVLMIVGGNILRRFSWKVSACVVPVVMILTSIVFFSAIIYGNGMPISQPMFTAFGVSFTAVALATQIGFWQGAVSKASKYSLFDSTKEMAYIPLDNELKTKGKAAVDVAGGRIGKSGGALTFSILQTIFPAATTPSLAPYLAVVAFAMFIAWFFAIGKLSTSLEKKEEDSKEESLKQVTA